jgi:hypothetical protein
MRNSFFKGVALGGFLLSGAAALVLFFFGQWPWSLGVLVSTAWIFLNIFFLFGLLEMGFNPPKDKRKERVLILSILKFPVLYVAGFFILKSRFFPIYSILLGLTLFMIAFTLVWFRFNFKRNLEGSAS